MRGSHQEADQRIVYKLLAPHLAAMDLIQKQKDSECKRQFASVRVGGIDLYPEIFGVDWNRTLVRLSGSQFCFVKALLENQGMVLSANELFNLLGLQTGELPDAFIRRLFRGARRQFEKADPDFAAIKFKRRAGYFWRAVSSYL